MKQFILKPGKICTLDPANVANQYENGICRVIIVKQMKTPLFSKKQFVVKPVDECGNIDDEVELTVNEEFLFPDGMCIIRYPSDLPVINDKDLDAVETALDLLNGPIFNLLSTDKRKIASMCTDRLSAIAEKFKYYMKIQEV